MLNLFQFANKFVWETSPWQSYYDKNWSQFILLNCINDFYLTNFAGLLYGHVKEIRRVGRWFRQQW